MIILRRDPAKDRAYSAEWCFSKALEALCPTRKDQTWHVYFMRDFEFQGDRFVTSDAYAILCKETGGLFTKEIGRLEGTKAKALRAQERYWDLAKRFGV